MSAFSGLPPVRFLASSARIRSRSARSAIRSELALKLKPLIAAKAKANQRASGGAVPQKSAKPVDTRQELARAAGVSHDTIHKVETDVLMMTPREDPDQDTSTRMTSRARFFRIRLHASEMQKTFAFNAKG